MTAHPSASDTKAINRREHAPGEKKESKKTGRRYRHRDQIRLPLIARKSGNTNDSSSGSSGSNHQRLMVDSVVSENDKQETVISQNSLPTHIETVTRSFSNRDARNSESDKASSPRIVVSPMLLLSNQSQLEQEDFPLFSDYDSGADSNLESPFMPELELPKKINYYSPFVTGFDFGIVPAYDTMKSKAMSSLSSKIDHDLVSRMAGWKDKAPLSEAFSVSTEEVDMVHETSILNFMNQVDAEDTAFFSSISKPSTNNRVSFTCGNKSYIQGSDAY
ncbi:hypothetical protein RMATCC62417_14430 [Rhizopus microsporus]|nr:hypothetical protein RMATCC62417_14430 [Rhizopus microsporus]